MIALDLNTLASICQVLAVLVFPVFIYGWRKLKAEMSPNHGSSMRDAVDRIEKDLKRNRKDIKRLADDLEAHLSYFNED
jgi:hypothetical protein